MPTETATAPTRHANPLPPKQDWTPTSNAAAAVAQFRSSISVSDVTRITAVETTWHGEKSVEAPTEQFSRFAQIAPTGRVWVVVARGAYVSSSVVGRTTFTWVAAAFAANAGTILNVVTGPGTWPIWFSANRSVLATCS